MKKEGEQMDLFGIAKVPKKKPVDEGGRKVEPKPDPPAKTVSLRLPEPDVSEVAAKEKLAIIIAQASGLEVTSVKWKDNMRVMASVGRHGILNLHRIYLRAKEADLRILMRILSGNATEHDTLLFHKYIKNNLPRELGKGVKKLVILPAKGLFHDLSKALERVLPLMDKPLEKMPRLGWTSARVGTTSLIWGTHRETAEGSLILLNAVLDAPEVPNFVLEHIVWHELCHEIVPPIKMSNGRRLIHHKAFQAMEKRYPRYDQAEKWQRENYKKYIRRHR